MPRVPGAVHHLRARRGDPADGGQEGRPPRSIRPAEGARGAQARLPETAGRRRSARGGGGRDRAAAPGDGREGSSQLGDRRGGDARAGAPRRGGLCQIRQRVPLLQGPRRVHERAEGADLGAQERAEEVTGQDFMRLALAEAEKGRGRTHPNPAVGAVVVRGGRVISRGHHEKAGLPHAEVNALREAGRDPRGADVYVTLEPCNHQGRTPPCTEALIAAGVRRVYFGSRDPNPAVRGHGADRLRRAGIEVHGRVLGEECDVSNEAWFKFITAGLPWVVLKAAVTLDGKLATRTGESKWISSEESRRLVHRWRDRLDAVLVGAGTVRADDPRLTVRGIRG